VATTHSSPYHSTFNKEIYVFENRLLSKIFGPGMEEVAGGQKDSTMRRLVIYSSPVLFR
jgi:hypothetical protein